MSMGYQFITARSIPHALELLDQHGQAARVVCGGTDLMVRLHLKRLSECVFINIRELEELRYIREEDGLIRIGAGTTLGALENSLLLLDKAPALFQAAQVFADPNVRHSATVGGNICNASPSADSAPSLLAFDAQVVIARKGGQRTLPVREFFTGVGRTALDPGEMVTEVRFRCNPNSAFVKVGLRSAMAISVVNIAASVDLTEDSVMQDVRIAVGAVAPTPVRAGRAEDCLRGKRPEEAVIRAAMDAVQADIKPITDVRASEQYRRIVTGNMMRRVVLKACGICENEGGAER